MLAGFIRAPQPVAGKTQVHHRIGVLRLLAYRLGEIRPGILERPFFRRDETKIVGRVGVTGADFKRPAKGGLAVFLPADQKAGHAEIGEDVRVIGGRGQRPAQYGHRILGAAHAQGDAAQSRRRPD